MSDTTDRGRAIELVERYVESWLTQNKTQFLETIHDDVTVRECDGSVYDGADACENWFRRWHAEGHRVQRWTIDSFLFDPDVGAAFEWDFECVVDGDWESFFGSTHATFRDGRLYSINEYERTKAEDTS